MSESETFLLNVRRLLDKAEARPELVLRKVSLEVLTRVVQRSPVGNPQLWKTPVKGYVGGRFRANWQVGIGTAPSGEKAGVDPSGGATIAAGSAVIADAKVTHAIYITNNLPYAWRLETGWSKQAPAGMVGITVSEFQSMVDNVP